MSEELLLLKLHEFFDGTKPLVYKRRSMILHAHDNPTSVFYIKSGYVRVYRISEQGEELTLTILKPHDFFPLTYGIQAMKNLYFLEAMTPLEIYKAPQDSFVKFMRDNPDIYYELTKRIFVRFNGVLTRMEQLVFSNAYTKVAATLLMCAKELGEMQQERFVIHVPLTHKDIATLTGITRETTSLEMKKLEKQGYICRDKRDLVLSDPEKMKQEIFADSSDIELLPTFNLS